MHLSELFYQAKPLFAPCHRGCMFVLSVGVIWAPSWGVCAGTPCPSHPLALVCLHTFSNAHQDPGESFWTSPCVDLMEYWPWWSFQNLWWSRSGQRLSPLSFRMGFCSYPSAKHHTQLDTESRNSCSAIFFLSPRNLHTGKQRGGLNII